MNKFLELVEENSPEQDIDALTDAKRSLQRLLMNRKIEAHGKAFEDILSVRLDDGRVVELEVKNVQHPVEDQEMKIDQGKDEFSVDDAVEGLGAKAKSGLAGFGAKILGTAAQNAKAAVKEREKLGAHATGLYKAKNRKWKTAIKAAKKDVGAL